MSHSNFRSPKLWLVAFCYTLLSLVPWFGSLSGQSPDQPLMLLALTLTSWAGMWALAGSLRWLHWIMLPAVLLLPVEIYLRQFYGQGISTHHLGIIAETSPREAAEFLGSKLWLAAAVLVALTGFWILLWRQIKALGWLSWRHWSRWPALIFAFIPLFLFLYGYRIGVQPASGTSASASAHAFSQPRLESARNWLAKLAGPLPNWLRPPFDEELAMRSWPFGLILRGADFWNERMYLEQLSEKSRAFSFGASTSLPDNTPQLMIMVIGESSRFDRWGLNGYERDTTPNLSAMENLVPLTDMITAVSATRLSVPIIVSRKPAAQGLQAGFAEKSFLSAYREAGFKTYWISNQMSFGQFDTPTSVFAKEADVTQFLNLGGYTNQSNLDEVLLAPLQHALNDPAQKKLIVLHTLGNHWNYSHRYPASFDRWKPSLFGVSNPAYTDLRNKDALNNSYDNSVLYTDWFLSEVIHQLKTVTIPVSMMYVADHGQTLYDDSCNLAFHGHNTQYEFHIPAFVWYSDLYAQQFPEKIKQLHRHRTVRLSTENVFHTLLDMAEIRYPDENLTRSFVSAAWRPHIRYVDSYGWTDYDNASLRGDCREVIANRDKPVKKKH
ncbi:phosphoethanolamine transferase [Undibacterium squillarum]|uniref:Sulfatase N-terminal domain-containing protein n=1 Tax=Undibacterium squillarum TaxID=1131567 RepID=A0ABQ2Y361_9BURK|nr:phosphoethanolamine transferase [Undibacterium squillarum]GGX54307.1 hypothetical protein GCM10010946_36230 [Undibacterium squillarum]